MIALDSPAGLVPSDGDDGDDDGADCDFKALCCGATGGALLPSLAAVRVSVRGAASGEAG